MKSASSIRSAGTSAAPRRPAARPDRPPRRTRRCAHVPRPHAVDGRVGARAEPEPLAVGPVLQVVARPPARPGHVRDLGTARSRRASSRSIDCRYISATSSSGATDHCRARHRVAQRRVRIHLEHVERRMIGSDGRSARPPTRATAATVCCGSHIIRSSDRLSKPAARASARRRRRGRRECSRVRRRSSSSRNDCTPKLRRLTPAARNAGQALDGHALRDWPRA